MTDFGSFRPNTFRRGALCALVTVAALARNAAAAAQIPCRYDVTIIRGPVHPIFGPASTTATGMNNLGAVVGSWSWVKGDHPFVWTEQDGMVTIPLPPGVTSAIPADINDAGVIVGEYDRIDVGFRGFVYDHGEWTELVPIDPQGWSGATAINNAGVICGWRSIGSPGEPINPYQAFIWSAKVGFVDFGLIDLISSATAVSEANQVVGNTGPYFLPGGEAFQWEAGRSLILEKPEGSLYYSAWSINERATIVGTAAFFYGTPPTAYLPVEELSRSANRPVRPSRECDSRDHQPTSLTGSYSRAVIWSGNGVKTLDPLRGFSSSWAFDVNDNGVVVGRCVNLTKFESDSVGVAWFDEAPIDLNDVVHGPESIHIVGAERINERGQIIANADALWYPVGALLTPVWSGSTDIDRDCATGLTDLSILLDEWGASQSEADFNRDGTVNALDLGILLVNWTIE